MWRKLRIALLLIVLATVALGAWRAKTRTTEWRHTLFVAIYPINADGRDSTEQYIRQLDRQDFEAIETWLDEQAKRYGITLMQPIRIELAPPRTSRPPVPPARASGLDVLLWSLQMRYWAWQNDDIAGPRPDIRLFAQYQDPRANGTAQHSLGLEKGLIGLVNLFASRHEHGGNLVVLAHEMLHTLGASDKYDLATTLPRFPDGYAEPQRSPRYPQDLAEIMGGRIPLSDHEAEIPRHITHTIVGPVTAREIGWIH